MYGLVLYQLETYNVNPLRNGMIESYTILIGKLNSFINAATTALVGLYPWMLTPRTTVHAFV